MNNKYDTFIEEPPYKPHTVRRNPTSRPEQHGPFDHMQHLNRISTSERKALRVFGEQA